MRKTQKTQIYINIYTNTFSVKVSDVLYSLKVYGTRAMFPSVLRSNTQIVVVQDSHSNTGSSLTIKFTNKFEERLTCLSNTEQKGFVLALRESIFWFWF